MGAGGKGPGEIISGLDTGCPREVKDPGETPRANAIREKTRSSEGRVWEGNLSRRNRGRTGWALTPLFSVPPHSVRQCGRI